MRWSSSSVQFERKRGPVRSGPVLRSLRLADGVANAHTPMLDHMTTAPTFAFLADDSNEKGRKVEEDVAMCPLLSLFRREENRDGVACVPFSLTQLMIYGYAFH